MKADKTCVHFTGIMQPRCEKGVCYADVRIARTGKPAIYPCLSDGQSIPCEHRRYPTPEEQAEEKLASERRFEQVIVTCGAIVRDLEARGLESRPGVKGEFPCELCEQGTLRYAFAGPKAHLHVACSTEGCVKFMQ